MKYICFFTNGHNGDVVHSKSFIEDITRQLDIPCLFHHKSNPKVSQDLTAKFTQISPPDYYSRFIETKKIFFVNTWLYPYSLDDFFMGVNMDSNYQIYSGICEVLNQRFNKNIKLKDIELYLPFNNFDNMEKNNIEIFAKSNSNKKVLFCNGPCLSGQTCYNDDMSEIIQSLSKTYTDIIFIATQKFETICDNIVFTDDIINIKGSDLNEIGYLSTFCDLIIGRNSGPFCFCTNKTNYNNENKIFFAFGHDPKDCFHESVKIKAKFVFDNSENKDTINKSIEEVIKNYVI